MHRWFSGKVARLEGALGEAGRWNTIRPYRLAVGTLNYAN